MAVGTPDVGLLVGLADGAPDGSGDGRTVGWDDGEPVGLWDGEEVGNRRPLVLAVAIRLA